MYTEKNYKTKRALKADFNAGVPIPVFQPGPFPARTDGPAALEGPHYPAPHSWYASVELRDGVIVKLDGKARKVTP